MTSLKRQRRALLDKALRWRFRLVTILAAGVTSRHVKMLTALTALTGQTTSAGAARCRWAPRPNHRSHRERQEFSTMTRHTRGLILTTLLAAAAPAPGQEKYDLQVKKLGVGETGLV